MSLSSERLLERIRDLASLPQETEWVEFKENNEDPEEIGEYLSALANAAARLGKPQAYFVWGVKDATHDVVGTTFRPRTKRVKGQELENWLVTNLHPQIHFRIYEAGESGNHFVLFEIPAAAHTPVRFKDTEYIRVGSYKKKLREHPEIERSLWAILSRTSFEEESHPGRNVRPGHRATRLPELLPTDEAAASRQPPGYFGPDAPGSSIAEAGSDRYHITNIGAMLFARNLSDFRGLSRKALRVIILPRRKPR